LDKRMKALDEEIEEKAYELATDSVNTAITERQKRVERKERSIEELINDIAITIINENEQYLGKEVADEAKEKVKEKRAKAKGGEKNAKEEQKSKNRIAG